VKSREVPTKPFLPPFSLPQAWHGAAEEDRQKKMMCRKKTKNYTPGWKGNRGTVTRRVCKN